MGDAELAGARRRRAGGPPHAHAARRGRRIRALPGRPRHRPRAAAAHGLQPLPRRRPIPRLRRPRRARRLRRSRALPRRRAPRPHGVPVSRRRRARDHPRARARRARAAPRDDGRRPRARSASTRLERRHVGDRLAFYLETATQLGLPLAPRPTRDARPARDPRRGAGLRGLALRRARRRRRRSACCAPGSKSDARAAWPRRAAASPRRGAPRRARTCPSSCSARRRRIPSCRSRRSSAPPSSNPRSCLAPYLLGVRLGYAGVADEAAAALQRARAIAPSFGAPQERLAELAEAAGRIDEACLLYEEAALQNSAFALPVARLADGRARARAASTRPSGCSSAASRDDPDLWLTNLVVGRAYLAQRRFHEARVHLAARARRTPRTAPPCWPSSPRPRSASAISTPRATRSRRPAASQTE